MAQQDKKSVAKTTPDIVAAQVEKLKQLFPEVVSEGARGGSVDFDRLRATLGDLDALADSDAYTFTWAGKEEAFRAIQTPSAASLRPAPEASVNWETTKHLFIEGENLEVLKLLYKSYVGKVKMIYIDPPYNTGNDFIYRDDYREPLQAYLEKTGQVDAEGNVLTSNPETRGRYHSDWLTMMYPRLFLARQLLREDGVIFVSIDDNEVHHLRLLMNEIFGEENFLATLVRRRRMASGMRNEPVSSDHEYILAYARLAELAKLYGTSPEESDYPFEDGQGRYRSTDLTVGMTKEMRPNQYYPIEDPNTGEQYLPPEERVWRFQPSTMAQYIEKGDIIWPSGNPDSRMTRPRFKTRYDPEKTNPVSTWVDTHQVSEFNRVLIEAGLNQEATKELRDLLGSQVLEYPKPVSLLKALVSLGSNDDDIVMDFFCGSATTAHAVLEANQEDERSRRFIMVQIAESTETDSPARQSGYQTIAEVSKDRIRRVIERFQPDEYDNRLSTPQLALDLDETSNDDTLSAPQDLGFKVFKLAPSTFRRWEPPEEDDAAALEQQLSFFDAGLKDDADPQHTLYEVLLKEGYSLNSEVEPLAMGANRVYRITGEAFADEELKGLAGEAAGSSDEGGLSREGGEGDETRPLSSDAPSFYLCLDDEIATATLDALPLDEETVFICQDAALDDSQKVNLALQCVLKTL
jgi:adenine-specific DNA-methyltransferase